MRKINEKCIKLIGKYQATHNRYTPARCLHYPSCSHYAQECYAKFGFFKATFLMIKRIICCNPLTTKTFDPVPLNKEEKLRLKNANKKSEIMKDALLSLAKVPDATFETYHSLIIQATFGPFTFKENQLQSLVQDAINKAHNLEGRFQISDEYMIIQIGEDTDLEALLTTYDSTTIKSEVTDTSFLEYSSRLNYLFKLVKKGKIKLDKKETKDNVYKAMCDYNFKTLSNNEYPYKMIHFLVIKK